MIFMDCASVMKKVASETGLHVTGCQVDKRAHRTDFKVFIKSDKPKAELENLLDRTSLRKVYGFVRQGKFKHDANVLFDFYEGEIYNPEAVYRDA